MRKNRFAEAQIIKVLKEHAAGLSAGELCRKYGISDATFYKWLSRYGGMGVSDARKLKALEDKNRRLKNCWRSPCWMRRRSRRCWEKTSGAQLAEASCDLGGPRAGLAPGRICNAAGGPFAAGHSAPVPINIHCWSDSDLSRSSEPERNVSSLKVQKNRRIASPQAPNSGFRRQAASFLEVRIRL